MATPPHHPIIDRAIPAAEGLIRAQHFSIENLCHTLDCGLRELAEAFPTKDDLVARVNEHFMRLFIERANRSAAEAANDLEAVCRLCSAWYDHTLEHPQQTQLLLQHQWAPDYVRPEWYLETVNACFAIIEARLTNLAPQASPSKVRGLARSLYATSCGLYFLTVNERATPAGIADQHNLLKLIISLSVVGLQKDVPTGNA